MEKRIREVWEADITKMVELFNESVDDSERHAKLTDGLIVTLADFIVDFLRTYDENE